MYPIFIPTKSRPTKQKTLKALAESGIEATLVVEPQQLKFYRVANPKAKFLVLDKNDMGIGYARQFILEFVRKSRVKFYWQMDDDIRKFSEVINSKIVKSDANKVLNGLEEFISDKTGQISLPYSHTVFFSRGVDFMRNVGGMVTCVLTNSSTGVNYDTSALAFEDVEFSIKNLQRNFSTLLVNKYCIVISPGGLNDETVVGGCSEIYRNNKHLETLRKICENYPNFAKEILNSKGQVRLKIHWNQITQSL